MRQTLFSLLCTILFQTLSFGAQENPVFFEKIDQTNGLSLATVYSILKDSKGFMWFGTRDGLNRYDGYSMKVFKHLATDKFSLNSNEILSLTEDSIGNIWIGTQAGGINILDFKSQLFLNNNNSPQIQRIRSKYINCIYKDQKKNIWIGTRDGLYLAHTQEDKNIYSIYFEEISKDIVPIIGTEFVVRQITGLKSGNLILSCEDGVYLYYIKERKLKLLNDPLLNASIFTSAYNESNNKLWLASLEKGLIKIYFDSDESGKIIKKEIYNANQPGAYFIPSMRVEFISNDSKNNLWVGTRNGLIRFNLNTNEKSIYQNAIFDSRSISDNKINTIFADKEEMVWIGTEYRGVNKVDLNSKPFFQLKNLFEKNFVADENYVTSITGNSVGKVFLGTDGKGIAYWDIENKEKPLRLINTKTLPGFKDDLIISLLQDVQGDLWIGSNSNAIGKYNPIANQIKYYNLKGYIFALAQGSNNTIWIGSWNEGLYRFDKQSGKIINYRHIPFDSLSLSSNIVLSVMEDREHNLWIGTKGAGLNVLRNAQQIKEKVLFENFLNNPNDSSSLSNNDVNCIFQASDGTIWVCTAGGLNKVIQNKEKQIKFQGFLDKEGMPNSYIHGILEDKFGNLWMSTNKGITHFDLKNKKFTNYDSNDGLQSDEFRHNAYHCDPSGRLFFGGNNGINYFFADSIHTNPYKPNVVITDIKIVGNNPESKNRFAKNIPENIVLKYSDKEITIEFSALHFAVPQKNRYAYRLKGFNKNWQQTDANNRKITYTNLDNGDYVFEVKASNNDGLWNDVPTTLHIEVLPPIWKTIWAYLFYATFLAFILILFRKYSLIAVKEKNKLILEHLEKEKLEELSKMKLQFFTNVSHELRTPLTLIKSPLDDLLQYNKLDDFTRRSLTLIQKNVSRLLQMSNQLLDFRKIDSGRFKLSLSQINIVDLLKDVYKDFEPLAQSRKIEYHFNTTDDNIEVWIDPERIKTVFYNLLSNAFKYSKNGSSIMAEVSVVLKEFKPSSNFKKNFTYKNSNKIPFVLINIVDSGMGIEKHSIKKIFERFYQANEAIPHIGGSGIGLAISREYVESHGGFIIVESSEHEGSCFSIFIPKGKDHFKNEHAVIASESIADYENVLVLENNGFQTQDLETEEGSSKSDQPLILIIEDNEEMLLYLKQSLSENYRVICALNGDEGYILAGEQNPDLILTDLTMPGMDGIDLCEHLKSELPTCHIPIIILTARVSDESNIRGLETGADVYINKPFNIHILKAQIKSLLDSRQRLKSILAKELIVQPKDVTVASLDERFLAKLMEVVEEHASDPNFGIKELTEKMNMSHSVIFRKIKSITGLTVVDYIRSFRLKKAALMLSKKKLPISEVSFLVGFSDPKYFSKCFQKEFGLSPTEYAAKKNPE